MKHLPTCRKLVDRECGFCDCRQITPILTPAQVQEMEAYYTNPAYLTHYEDCWQGHPHCAIARLIASHRALEQENVRLQEQVDAAAWSISPAMAQAKIDQLREERDKQGKLKSENYARYEQACVLLTRSECKAEDLKAEATRLRGALEEIKDMPQGELQAAMNEGDTLHILGCMANLFNSCRDIAQQALATPDANKKVPHD